MFPVLVALASLCGIVFVVGIALLFVARGKAKMTGDDMRSDPGTVGAHAAGAKAYRGRGVRLQGEASTGYDEVKAALRDRRWRDALPSLMAMAGLTGAVSLGLLAVLVKAENKLVAGVFAAVFWYAFARIWIEFASDR